MSQPNSTQPTAAPSPGLSKDAKAMMMYEANAKSPVVAYLLWFFLGGFGAHRYYTGRIKSGLGQLALLILGYALSVVVVGFLFLIALGIWWIVDAFLMPGWIRELNSKLANQLGG